MLPHDLLQSARILLSSAKGRPTAVSLRRATSSAYYAIFHCLPRECADLLIGGAGAARSNAAWRQVYRALEHGATKDRCKNRTAMRQFPQEIGDFANVFVTMQENRHEADYDPFRTFSKSEVMVDIAAVEQAMSNFRLAGIRHRRAFCAFVLFKGR